MLKPTSDNIVFFDAEFSSLDPYKGELLSIGLVKPSGEQLYVEIEHAGDIDPWVEKNVVPYFEGNPVSRQEAVARVVAFLGGKKPYMVANVNQFDAIYWYKMAGLKENPFFWLPIDFASMMFALGLDPMWKLNSDFLARYDIDKKLYRAHHALDDARLLRDVYMKMQKS